MIEIKLSDNLSQQDTFLGEMLRGENPILHLFLCCIHLCFFSSPKGVYPVINWTVKSPVTPQFPSIGFFEDLFEECCRDGLNDCHLHQSSLNCSSPEKHVIIRQRKTELVYLSSVQNKPTRPV